MIFSQMSNPEDHKVSITVQVPVRLHEIDYLRIVHASNYLRYMEYARIKLFEQQGLDLPAWQEKGIRAKVANDTIDYLYPATYGDVLAIRCWVDQIRQSTVRFRYRISEEKTGKEILKATSTVTAINSYGKLTRIPKKVKEALGRTT